MFCSKCGSDNPDVARFCGKCGAPMALASPPPQAAVPETMRGAVSQMPGPGAVTAAASVTGKTPWVATLLSFFITGLGQLYNGDIKKGAVMFGLAVLGLIFTGGLLTFGVWIWGMVDGWQVAAGKFKPW